jgi:PTS system galactitol-specific IIB component
MRKFKVLSVCGTGIATSTVAAEKTKEMLSKRGISVDVIECKVTEVSSKVDSVKPDIIVHTTPVSDDASNGIKKFFGLPFLTGIGMDQLSDKIAEYLRSLDK